MSKLEIIDAYKTSKLKKIKTKKVLRKIQPKKSKRVLGYKIMYFSMFFVPLFICLFIVSRHSSELFKPWMSVILLILAVVSVWALYLGFTMVMLNRKIVTGRHYKKWFKALAVFVLAMYVGGGIGFTALLYGPYKGFREWLITTAMTTMSHQYYATWFYGPKEINEVFANNRVIESGENTNPDLIQIAKPDGKINIYANKYEEELLDKIDGDYKIIDIRRSGFRGKLVAIYDPSKVKLATSKGMGTSLDNAYGELLINMSKRYNAKIGINAGGFYDPTWMTSGGVPHGIVIADGKLKANNPKASVGGGLVGFTNDNKLVLTRVSAQKAISMGVRDAVEFGPYLIVNGKPSFIKGNGGWGYAPRTAIGQRKDGIVLFVVIDGRQTASRGADMVQLTELMQDYGAVNAACMDGGTSSAMSLDHKLISNPRDGRNRPQTRRIPNAWLFIS